MFSTIEVTEMCWNSNCPVLRRRSRAGLLWLWRCELKQSSGTPAFDHPFWSFEVLFATKTVECNQILRGKEEGVRELIAVYKKGEWKSPVCV